MLGRYQDFTGSRVEGSLAFDIENHYHLKKRSLLLYITLSEMKPGERGRICGFRPGDRAYRQKLLAMGLTMNAEFTFIRLAPLGDPIQLEVRQSYLCLRKAEAEILKIERLS